MTAPPTLAPAAGSSLPVGPAARVWALSAWLPGEAPEAVPASAAAVLAFMAGDCTALEWAAMLGLDPLDVATWCRSRRLTLRGEPAPVVLHVDRAYSGVFVEAP